MNSVNDLKALKSVGWYTISHFLMGFMAFFTTSIFARLMTKTDFGSFQNYLSWLSVFGILCSLNVNSSMVSGKYDYRKCFDRFVYSILVLGAVSSLCWFAIFLVCPEGVKNKISLDSEYTFCMFLYLLCSMVINVYKVREIFAFRYENFAILSLAVSFSTTIVSLILFFSIPDKLQARILGYSIPTILVGLILFFQLERQGKEIDFSCWRYVLSICLPYIPHLLSLTLLSSMDRIMISSICGVEYTALYALAYTCGRVGSVLLTSMNTAYNPWLVEQLMEKNYKKIRKFSYVYVSAFAYLMLGIMLLAPEILYILGGSAYMEAIYVLTPVTAGCVCEFLYTMFVNIEQAMKRTMGMATASVSAALLNYILNLVFIPHYGYLSAAYTTLVGYLWLLLSHMFLVKRIGCDDAYNYKFILGMALGMAALSVGISYLYRDMQLRWALIVLYGIVGIYLWHSKWAEIKEWRKRRTS